MKKGIRFEEDDPVAYAVLNAGDELLALIAEKKKKTWVESSNATSEHAALVVGRSGNTVKVRKDRKEGVFFFFFFFFFFLFVLVLRQSSSERLLTSLSFSFGLLISFQICDRVAAALFVLERFGESHLLGALEEEAGKRGELRRRQERVLERIAKMEVEVREREKKMEKAS